MNALKRYQNIIIAGVLIIGAFLVYSYFFTGTPQAALSAQPASANAAVDQDLISLLSTLKNITLDDSIFKNGVFQSLQDFSQNLVPEPVGRTNPFAPLGGVSKAQ